MTFDTTHAELLRQRDARRAYASQEAARACGVTWSGLGPDPILTDSDEVVAERAERLNAEREAWMASPRGKLTFALAELREVGAAAEADVVYGAFCRGFRDEREPVNTAEVARALKALDTLPRATAADARDAIYAVLADNENTVQRVSAFLRRAAQ